MATRVRRLTIAEKNEIDGRRMYPTAFARALKGWRPSMPADPQAQINNSDEIRCVHCGTRLESAASYSQCPFCESDNPDGSVTTSGDY